MTGSFYCVAGTVIFRFVRLADVKPGLAMTLGLFCLPRLSPDLGQTWHRLASILPRLAGIIQARSDRLSGRCRRHRPTTVRIAADARDCRREQADIPCR